MSRLLRWCAGCTAGLLAATGPFAAWAPLSGQTGSLLTYGITGSTGTTPAELDPTTILADTIVQRALLAVAATPRGRGFLDSALGGAATSLDRLVRAGLLKNQGATYVLDFTLLSAEDVRRVHSVVEPLARSLADAYLAHRAQFDSLFALYPRATVDRKAIAFVVIGCFALDWDGLRFTAARGYRAETRQWPWGAAYAIWGEARQGLSLEGVYWGSHYTEYGATALATFGDHFTLPRDGFPDIVGRLAASPMTLQAADSGARAAGAAVARDLVQRIGPEVAATMMALRDGDRSEADLATVTGLETHQTHDLVAFLEALRYVATRDGRVQPVVPVFSLADSGIVRAAVRLSREIDSTWLAAHYDGLRHELSTLSPVREGVPYAEVFTQVWHYVFGLTNRELVRAGMVADPYAASRTSRGFIPFVWEVGVVETP